MTPDEFRKKNTSELQTLEKELRTELFNLKVRKRTGQLEKSHRLLELKKDIARVLTINNEQAKKAV